MIKAIEETLAKRKKKPTVIVIRKLKKSIFLAELETKDRVEVTLKDTFRGIKVIYSPMLRRDYKII